MNEFSCQIKGNKNYKKVVIAQVKLLTLNEIKTSKYNIKNTDKEIKKLLNAIKSVKKEIKNLNNDETRDLFNFYTMFLEDEDYINELITNIKKEKLNASYIIQEKNLKTINFFENLYDPKMKEKKEDLNSLTQRILKFIEMEDYSQENYKSFKNKIIFTKNISPLKLLELYHDGVKAIVTEKGTFTSHTSILASDLDISYMIGAKDSLSMVKDNDFAIIDGFTGNIYINPSPDFIIKYKNKRLEQAKLLEKYEKDSIKKSFTKDGKYIKVMANVDIINMPKKIKKYNIEGIGLVRSEFIFHNNEEIPSYEEQLAAYKELLIENKDIDVTIRTFDFSEDKTPIALEKVQQNNPSLGLRGIRFSFYQDIFKTQFKALISASEFGNLKILFPMITTSEEVLKIKKIENEILKELKISKNYKLGVMIETISSVYILEDIKDEIDFISLGTNDLMQYFFAIDRDNNLIKDLSSPFAPSFIRFLKDVTSLANKYNIELSICGQLASIPNVIPILIGLNLDILSVDFSFIPIIKEVISKISYNDSKELIKKLISFSEESNSLVKRNINLVNQFLAEHEISII